MFFRDRSPFSLSARHGFDQFSANYRTVDENEFFGFLAKRFALDAAPSSDENPAVTENSVLPADEETVIQIEPVEPIEVLEADTREPEPAQDAPQDLSAARTEERAPLVLAAEMRTDLPAQDDDIQQVVPVYPVAQPGPTGTGGSSARTAMFHSPEKHSEPVMATDAAFSFSDRVQAVAASLPFQMFDRGNFNFGWTGPRDRFVNPTPVDPTPIDPTPTDPVDQTPTDPVDPTPTDPVDPTPTDPVDQTPTDPVDPTPTDPVDPTPTDPVDMPTDSHGDGGSMGGTDGDGHDPGGHDTGSAPSIPGYSGPIPPVTAAEIAAFVSAVQAEDDGMAHMGMETMSSEHMAAMDLVPRDGASHIAINNGAWNDPGTWHNGEVPGDGAAVLIPDGIMVNYGQVSDVSLFTVRVDGMLRFATNVDSRMEVDTIVVSPEGYLQIGTADNPVQAGVEVDIVIADNGNIDTNWDPMLLSRGIVSHGAVDIYGAEKVSALAVSEDPMAGDRTITLDGIPEGWQVGDKLVVTGTHLEGWYWDQAAGAMIHHEGMDEEVYITSIVGNSVSFDRPLQFDHDAPDGDFSARVANMTRNITVSSEGGEDLPVHQRGHVMFMHSDDVDVRYAGFVDLGRTDKSVAAFAASDLGTLEYDSNIQGRYSFHFHRTGTADQENPAIAVGNVVDGNPGWGFVHHASHAEFTDNVAFDVFGAAFAAEDGNETGIWLRNMAINVDGVSYGDSEVKLQSDVDRHDNGRTGEGFFFAGRLVEAAENVAVNTTHGYVYMHRSQPLTPLSDNLDQPEIAHGSDTIRVDQAPIHGFRDNEVFASQIGLIVVKNGPDQNHDVRSVIEGFTAWEVAEGINLSYTSHYTFLDTTLVGTENPYIDGTRGLVLGVNNFDVVMNGLDVDGFDTGVDMSNNILLHGALGASEYRNFFIDADLSGNRTDVRSYDDSHYTFLSSADLTEGRLSFDLAGPLRTALGDGFTFDGTKTDSIGSTDRQFELDTQGFDEWGVALREHLEANGYYELADGTNVIMVEDFVADRATGELLKFAHVIELANSDGVLANNGYTNNGTLNPGGPSAVAGDDQASTGVNQDVFIDVLGNDYDPDGGSVYVDGTVDPSNGDVFVQENGQIMYRPNRDFTGVDSFQYWAADEEGNFSAATVTVEVWDGMM